MKRFDLQYAILLGIIFSTAAAISAAADPTSTAASQTPVKAQNTDDEADDWIFDSTPYTENPETGKRVWQYAKEKTVYTNATSIYSAMPRYFSSDPFFLPNTDIMFFMNSPDPFYAEPIGYPSELSVEIGSDHYFYGLDNGSINLRY